MRWERHPVDTVNATSETKSGRMACGEGNSALSDDFSVSSRLERQLHFVTSPSMGSP